MKSIAPNIALRQFCSLCKLQGRRQPFLRSSSNLLRRPTRSRCDPRFLPIHDQRTFHTSPPLQRIETHTLSDIGEGVKEVQIIQWFVEEGAAIEEWSPLCEVQSDKASVEITSKFSGVIKKIHFERDAIVQVGNGMVDIEVEGEGEADAAVEEEAEPEPEPVKEEEQIAEDDVAAAEQRETKPENEEQPPEPAPSQKQDDSSKQASLATPAVRGLLKEHGIAIEDIEGTGKDGRVLKEDVMKHLEGQQSTDTSFQAATTQAPKPGLDSKQTETPQKLTPIQSAMFKSMTASLSIPHFLYSDTINITSLSNIRHRLNTARANPSTDPKLSYLPFIIKAVSLTLNQHPLLNARINTSTNSSKPELIFRSNHNIGVAMDTPSGLLVPVIKSVNSRSIMSITNELHRLSKLGQEGKLGTSDLSGGTITVSNIGNIGGEVVAPVIVEGQLAILGIGKIKAVPVFGEDGETIERAEMMTLSWSADHRVVDGATMARMAKVVQTYLEEPGRMIVDMS